MRNAGCQLIDIVAALIAPAQFVALVLRQRGEFGCLGGTDSRHVERATGRCLFPVEHLDGLMNRHDSLLSFNPFTTRLIGQSDKG